jgi:hypothetical protein
VIRNLVSQIYKDEHINTLTCEKEPPVTKRRIGLIAIPGVADYRARLLRLPAEQRKSRVEHQVGDSGNAGPSGQESKDAELEVTVKVALSSTNYPLRTVVVVVTAGRVLLVGRIPSFYLKQVAQEAVRRVSGVAGCDNLLVVERLGTTPIHPENPSGL